MGGQGAYTGGVDPEIMIGPPGFTIIGSTPTEEPETGIGGSRMGKPGNDAHSCRDFVSPVGW
jgi:hypothetical protein